MLINNILKTYIAIVCIHFCWKEQYHLLSGCQQKSNAIVIAIHHWYYCHISNINQLFLECLITFCNSPFHFLFRTNICNLRYKKRNKMHPHFSDENELFYSAHLRHVSSNLCPIYKCNNSTEIHQNIVTLAFVLSKK